MMKDRSEISVNMFNKHAVNYASKYASVAKYQDGLDVFCDKLAKNSSVLDLACGPGNISKYLQSIRPDLKVLGIDLAPKMIEIATRQNPNADFEIGDIRDVKSLNQNFDALILGFGMPYLSKEEVQKFIVDARERMSEKGILYLSTMEGKYSGSGFQKSSDGKDEMFIYFHEQEYIKSFLNGAGFQIIWEKQQPYIENGETRFSDYIVIAQKLT